MFTVCALAFAGLSASFARYFARLRSRVEASGSSAIWSVCYAFLSLRQLILGATDDLEIGIMKLAGLHAETILPARNMRPCSLAHDHVEDANPEPTSQREPTDSRRDRQARAPWHAVAVRCTKPTRAPHHVKKFFRTPCLHPSQNEDSGRGHKCGHECKPTETCCGDRRWRK